MTDRVLTIAIFLTLGCNLALAQEYCLNNPDPQVRGSVGVGLQIDPESTSQSVECTQYFKADVGQRLVFVTVSEAHLQDFAPCANTVNPLCDSAYTFSLTNSGTGATLFSRSRSTNGLDGAPSGSEWTSEQTGDGTLWTRKTIKAFDVSSQTGQSEALFLFSMQTTRSQSFNVIGFGLFFDGAFVFDLSQTDFSMLPRDSRETAVAKCDEPQNFCTVDYYAGFSGGNGFQAKITFELDKPNGMSTYRPGTSSNYSYRPNPQSESSPDSSATDPDFILESSQVTTFDAATNSGQVIVTQDEVSYGAVTVRSRDYGGSTVQRAKAMIGGDWIYAAPPPAYDTSFNQLPAASCAVGEGDTRPFTQIPIDVDCNGIADSWEAQYAVTGPSLGALSDEESAPNASASNISGDGFAALDEYRGFHVIENGGPRHTRARPDRFDVFFADKSSALALGTALREGGLLRQLLDGIVDFHEVDTSMFTVDGQGNSKSLNTNGSVPAGNSQLHNFVVQLADASGEFCNKRVAGTIQEKSAFPLWVCTSELSSRASQFSITLDGLLQVIVAHEIGHRMNLDHYVTVRTYHPTLLALTQLSQVESTEYAEATENNHQFYTSVHYFLSPGTGNARIPTILDKMSWGEIGPLFGISKTQENLTGSFTGASTFQINAGLAYFVGNVPLSEGMYRDPLIFEIYDQRKLMSYATVYELFDQILTNYVFAATNPDDKSLIQPNRPN